MTTTRKVQRWWMGPLLVVLAGAFIASMLAAHLHPNETTGRLLLCVTLPCLILSGFFLLQGQSLIEDLVIGVVVTALGLYLRHTATHQIAKWTALATTPPPGVSINMSGWYVVLLLSIGVLAGVGTGFLANRVREVTKWRSEDKKEDHPAKNTPEAVTANGANNERTES